MDVEHFSDLVNHANAIRRVRNLQPIGGKGDYVSPPTYLGKKDKTPIHVFETRRINGNNISCVLLDSVQSQANRLEESIYDSIKKGEIKLPNAEVDFSTSDVNDIGVISSLVAPHRIFDAIIRDSTLEGEDFLKSDVGKEISIATPHNASVLFKYAPTTLIFGGWNSMGDRGGNGPRFQRCLVSEIVGIGVPTLNETDVITSASKKTSSRIDPLQIENVEIYEHDNQWEVDKTETNDKKKKPSELVHGNIPPTIAELGATMDYALQTTTITLAGLRRLSFPNTNGMAENDIIGWTVLAALALFAISQQDKNGYSLRSRCDLVPVPEENSGFEFIHNDGKNEKLEMTNDQIKTLLLDSIKAAKDQGLSWHDDTLKLLPQDRLVKLIKKSRNKSMSKSG